MPATAVKLIKKPVKKISESTGIFFAWLLSESQNAMANGLVIEINPPAKNVLKIEQPGLPPSSTSCKNRFRSLMLENPR